MKTRGSRPAPNCDARLGDAGFSLVEALVALVLTAIITTGLSTHILTTAVQERQARRDLAVWNAVHTQMDALMAQGWTNVSNGSASVNGFPMAWTVSGNTLKTIQLVVQVPSVSGTARPDTFVTYLSNN